MRSTTPLLCDTNVISELARPNPNRGVVAWADTLTSITISVVTLEEIAYGVTWKPSPRIRAWFDDFVTTQCEVVPVSVEIAVRAGELRGEFARRGVVRAQADMLIAATAQVYGLAIVTRNVKDFEDCIVPLLNPFV